MLVRATTCVMLLATPAFSAELLRFDTAAGAVDWSGRYAGVTFGTVRSDGKATRGGYDGDLLTLDVSNGLFPDSIDESATDAIGGLAVGVNRQRGSTVFGFELDLSLSGLDAQSGFSRVDPGPVFPGVDTITSYRTEIDRLATARLRAGYAQGRMLFYGTAGLALGHVENSFTLALPQIGYSSPDWNEEGYRLGYVFGAGVEGKLTPRVSLKAEILRFDLEDSEVDASDEQNFPGNSITYEFDNEGVVARLGLNFRF